MFSCILFDLDGTISDPKQGICGCVQYALRSFGIENRNWIGWSRLSGRRLQRAL